MEKILNKSIAELLNRKIYSFFDDAINTVLLSESTLLEFSALLNPCIERLTRYIERSVPPTFFSYVEPEVALKIGIQYNTANSSSSIRVPIDVKMVALSSVFILQSEKDLLDSLADHRDVLVNLAQRRQLRVVTQGKDLDNRLIIGIDVLKALAKNSPKATSILETLISYHSSITELEDLVTAYKGRKISKLTSDHPFMRQFL